MIKILYFTITLKAAICIGASSPKKSPKGSNLCINGNYLYDWDEDCKILTLVESEDSICRFNQDRKNCKFYHPSLDKSLNAKKLIAILKVERSSSDYQMYFYNKIKLEEIISELGIKNRSRIFRREDSWFSLCYEYERKSQEKIRLQRVNKEEEEKEKEKEEKEKEKEKEEKDKEEKKAQHLLGSSLYKIIFESN
tara:strand:- start:533 stop:1117 length:585 start_codon:yes stop_codon:yes gene_type:complete